MKIKILSSEVVDQIAAGEVVERPAHLIKELVENSLDAGATEIEVFFDQGGRFVRVTDNGKGIHPEDLSRALDRYATSKIELSSDLWKLKTFGFRGEALASISAVSRLTLKSRTPQAEMASQLTSEFGMRSDVHPVGASFGTTIQIEDLFANTPVRLKFLKSDSAEGVQIKQMLKAMALANPHVQFKIFQGKDLLFLWQAVASRKERAQQVLEVKSLFEGEAQRGGVKAFAVFADPNTTAKTARQILLFVQNRWIQDRGLQAAVMEAYRSLLMHGEYPIAAVWVECDPEFVDVNVHPTKSQVKFQEPSLAFRAVQASLRDYLEKAPWVEEIMKRNPVDSPVSQSERVHFGGFQPEQSLDENVAFDFSQNTRSSNEQNSIKQNLKDVLPPENHENLKFQGSAFDSTQFSKKTNFSPESPKITFKEWSQLAPFKKSEPINDKLKKWSLLQVLGQANLTYIVCQSREGLIFIDQHAAHERVAYEKLMQAWKGGKIEIQEYLFPLSLELSPDRVEALKEVFSDFEKLGLYLEVLGPHTVGVKAAPLFLKDQALLTTIEKASQDLVDYGGSFRFEKTVGDCCATMACHSVVRAGQALSHEQMESLLEEMDAFPMSTFCPHGRPVFVEYPFVKLEKDFGRLV